jgi:UDP-N-acetylglucosamine 4,6-dehydratase (inverting)
MINNSSKILVTGGTGSFGKFFVKKILKKYPKIKRLVIFSRDELKQYEFKSSLKKKYPGLRFFIGDIRDKERLKRALEDIDIVVHAAALKQVDTAEYNPIEYINTNIMGAKNLIECSLDLKVKKVVALSTDKAAAPINLYGATKLCSDKLFVAANNISTKKNCKFSVVRYGNVFGSRGSIVPYLLNNKSNTVNLTDIRMTRFFITLEKGYNTVVWTINNMIGGEIVIPKIPSIKIIDLIKTIKPKSKIINIGIRPGEKIHEQMITVTDGVNTYELDKYFLILNNFNSLNLKFFKKHYKILKPVKNDFEYSSNKNIFLDSNDIKKLLKN